jgi:uncharacterized protein with ParB-like and HNH nuclease domain
MIEFSANRTMGKILQDSFYQIPRFQRPFSWTLDNVGDLWSDTIQQSTGQYFIGAFIVYKQPPDKHGNAPLREYAIVDGQQRLTTVTVLIAALRDQFSELGEEDLAKGIQRYIQKEDKRNLPQLIIETEGGFPYFQTAIQSYPTVESGIQAYNRTDEKLLAQAYGYFRTQLTSLNKSVKSNTTIAKEDRTAAYVAELEKIRDRVLGLSAILVGVDDEDDAYEIFETLNARGKNLNLVDLLRNFLLRDLREQNDSLDVPRHRFNAVLASLQGEGFELEADEFVLHSWLSRHKYTSKKKLFANMKIEIKTKEQKAKLLRELELDVALYRKVRRPLSVTWSKEMSHICRSLRALQIFVVTQPTPLLLAALRSYENDKMTSLKSLKRLFAAVESFHFQYTTVTGASSSGGVSARYALHGRAFSDADGDSSSMNIDRLIKKLQGDMPSRDEFVAGFSEMNYSSTNSIRKDVVRYALERLYEASAGRGVTVDFTGMTIEHIAPEHPGTDDEALDPRSVESIGNLMLVSEALNQLLANKSFAEKQAILSKEKHLWIDPFILSAKSWGGKEIAERGRQLGDVGYNKVWKL